MRALVFSLVVSSALGCATVQPERIPFALAVASQRLPREPSKPRPGRVTTVLATAPVAAVSPELQAALLRFGNTLRAGRASAHKGAAMPSGQREAWGAALGDVDAYLAARQVGEMSPFDVARARVVLEAELEEDAVLWGDFPPEVAERAHGLLEALKGRLAQLNALKVRTAPADLKKFIWPLNPVVVTSPFGFRFHPIDGEYKQHKGVDLEASPAQPIYAAYAGTVIFSGWNGSYGNHLELQHDPRVSTTYSHLVVLKVKEGQVVKKGQLIGLAGDTGNATGVHLHFELYRDGHPMDPEALLPPTVDLFQVASAW